MFRFVVFWQLLKRDLVGFYIVPLAIAVALVESGIRISSNFVDMSLIGATILIPLLLNALLLIYSILEKSRTTEEEGRARTLLHHIYSNISYTVLISVIFLGPLIADKLVSDPRAELVLDGVNYFLLLHLLLTSLMILKRIHLLLAKEFEVN